LVSFKPSTILYEEEYEKNKNGIKAVHKVFVEEMGFKLFHVNSLMSKYPALLSKSEDELNEFFKIMNQ